MVFDLHRYGWAGGCHATRPRSWISLWGSETRFAVPCGQLRGGVVLVGESAEDLLPPDPVLGEVDRFRRVGVSLSWGELAEGTVRPGIVT